MNRTNMIRHIDGVRGQVRLARLAPTDKLDDAVSAAFDECEAVFAHWHEFCSIEGDDWVIYWKMLGMVKDLVWTSVVSVVRIYL